MSGVCSGCGKRGGEADLLPDGRIYSVKLYSSALDNMSNVPICFYDGMPDKNCIELYKAKVQKEIADREAKLKADLIEDEKKRKAKAEADKIEAERYAREQQKANYLTIYDKLIRPLIENPLALAELKRVLGISKAGE